MSISISVQELYDISATVAMNRAEENIRFMIVDSANHGRFGVSYTFMSELNSECITKSCENIEKIFPGIYYFVIDKTVTFEWNEPDMPPLVNLYDDISNITHTTS